MTANLLNRPYYTSVIERAEQPFVRICSAEGDTVLAFRMMTSEDICRFICFLNENQIERAHVKDCFDDYLYELYGMDNRE